MIKINNSTSENKPPWVLGEHPGPTRTSLSGLLRGQSGAAPSDTWTRLRRALAAATRAVPLACGSCSTGWRLSPAAWVTGCSP